MIEKHNDMDEYFKINNQNKYKHINAVFCMLGSQVKHGEETFRKIDKTYPLLAADIALQNSICLLIKKSLIIYCFHQEEEIYLQCFYT